MRPRKWSEKQLRAAAKNTTSIRQLIFSLGLLPAGGNYAQVKKYLKFYKIDITHHKGMAWSRGLTGIGKPRLSLDTILQSNSSFQSYKLKKRLYAAGLKSQYCEECAWAGVTPDGRIPLELDHINGNSTDNRLENLRILCPNCHALKSTHRGRNIKKIKRI